MAFAMSAEERAQLNARAAAIQAEAPDVFGLARHGLALDLKKPALIYLRTVRDHAPVTFSAGELLGLFAAATRWYRRAGVGAGDVVTVFAPTCPSTFVLYFAAMGAAVAHPLNLLFSREAVVAQVKAVNTKILLVPPPGVPGGLYEKTEGLEHEVPGIRRVVIPLDGSVSLEGETLMPESDFATMLDAASAARRPDDVVALLPTGGTTGAPKIARLSARAVVASAIGSMLAGDMRPSDRTLLALPLFHVGGSFCSSLPTMAAGGGLVIPTVAGLRNPEVIPNFWRLVESQKLSIAGLVPTALGAVADVPTAGADISSLRYFGVGASVCPPEIERRFLAVWGGDCVRQIYGMTEFAGAITSTPSHLEQHPSSAGPTVAQAEFAILRNGAVTQQAGSVGELLARGPQMFSGYVDERQTAGALYEGWLRTGDLVRSGADQDIYVTGRLKDLIIRGGHNIDPSMIEDAALTFPGVALAAAVGRPDAYAGETPMVFVTPTPGARLDRDALFAHLSETVSDAAAKPRAVEILDEMPVTPIGKIFKPRLREIAAEQAAREGLAGMAGVEVSATTKAERGLALTARGPEALRDAAVQALGRLPTPFEYQAVRAGA